MDRYDASLVLFNRLGFALKEEYANDKKIKEALEYVASEFKRCDKLEKAVDKLCETIYLQHSKVLTKEELKEWALEDE